MSLDRRSLGAGAGEGADGTHVLGVSAHFHDSAAALLTDGRVVAAAQEERFTRRKGEERFPSSAVASCLRQAAIAASDLDHVVFYERPRLKFDRLVRTWANTGGDGWASAREALPLWARHRLHTRRHVRRALGSTFRGDVEVVPHHLSHAASAYFPSPFARAATVVMDAVGEWSTSSIGVGRGAELRLLREQRFPHSLGMLYSAFTHYTGFRVNRGEYKLMGLAPFGEPRFVDQILDDVVAVHPDGSLRLRLDLFDFHRGGAMTAPAFHRRFGGPPRAPDEPFTQRHMDLAASVQQVCEQVVLATAHHARELTGERQVVLAGGVALNCVANGRLQRDGPFDDVWVQSASGDAGGALGAALLQWHHGLGQPRPRPRRDGQRASLLGPRHADDDVALYLQGVGAIARRPEDEATLLDEVAGHIESGLVVGWFRGPMEFGPRALGSRSILADPRGSDMQRVVNERIKFRESFRPFAPSVLRERVHELFDVPVGHDSPYMLFTVDVRASLRRRLTPTEKERAQHPDPTVRVAVPRSTLPAITHVDHSSRLQTVDAERHGRFHRLLQRFHARTGCPAVLNTSFNVRGEPIVQSPADAYRCFLLTDMDCLVLENHVLLKHDQPDHARAVVLSSDKATSV